MGDSLGSMEYNFSRNVEGPTAVDIQLQKQIDDELSRSVDDEILETKRKIKDIKSSQRRETIGKIRKGITPFVNKLDSFLGYRPGAKKPSKLAKKLSKIVKRPTVVVPKQPSLLGPMQRDRSRFFNNSFETERRQLFFK